MRTRHVVTPRGRRLNPSAGSATAASAARAALLGRAGRVVFRGVAVEASVGERAVPYRSAARGEAAAAHMGTRVEVTERVAHVREAWAAWALLVATAAVAPLVVALLTTR